MAFLTRTDVARNIDRFYVVDITPTLFGECAVLREWGRRGSSGTLRFDRYRAREEARSAEQRAVKRRLQRGYAARCAVTRRYHTLARGAMIDGSTSLTNALPDANIDRQKAERIATEIFDAIHDNVATKQDLQALQRMLLRFAEVEGADRSRRRPARQLDGSASWPAPRGAALLATARLTTNDDWRALH